jgi:hypothetical protein
MALKESVAFACASLAGRLYWHVRRRDPARIPLPGVAGAFLIRPPVLAEGRAMRTEVRILPLGDDAYLATVDELLLEVRDGEEDHGEEVVAALGSMLARLREVTKQAAMGTRVVSLSTSPRPHHRLPWPVREPRSWSAVTRYVLETAATDSAFRRASTRAGIGSAPVHETLLLAGC